MNPNTYKDFQICISVVYLGIVLIFKLSYASRFVDSTNSRVSDTEAATRGVLQLCSGPYNFIKKETMAQVFSCEFCEISKNTFLQNTSGGCFCITYS